MAPKTRFTPRHQYDDDTDAKLREATDLDTSNDPSVTVESYQEEVDLNRMVKRFGIGDGAIPPAAVDPRHYGDFSEVPDFRQAWDQVKLAENRFLELPADIRSKFDNDPVRLITYLEDPKNWEEAVELKILSKQVREPAEPPPAPKPTPEPQKPDRAS